MISSEKKAEIVAKYGKDAKDTGSPEVQVAILTARIKKGEQICTKSLKWNWPEEP